VRPTSTLLGTTPKPIGTDLKFIGALRRNVIAREIARWGAAPRALADAFGTVEPDAVATVVSEFCQQYLGASPAAYEFFEGGVGTVHGLRLDDGRRVAIKVHRADADLGFLTVVQETQALIADGGMAAPRPLLPPTPIAQGIAMVEELLDDGAAVPAHDATHRARMAADLRRFIVLATPQRAAFGHRSGFLTGIGETLYPLPHDRRFNLELPSGEWIDAVAERARETLRSWRGPLVVGHADWRVQNLRYDGGMLSAIYDWDSLVIRPEAAIVGAVAGLFTTDWTQFDRCGIPTRNEMAAFVTDYEAARGHSFSAQERKLACAALTYLLAYCARCQWSDMMTDMGRRPPTSPPTRLPTESYPARLASLAGH
jgi:phosphotransferase family enzyme